MEYEWIKKKFKNLKINENRLSEAKSKISAEVLKLINSNLLYLNYLLDLDKYKNNDRFLKDKIYLLEFKASLNEASTKEYITMNKSM